MFFYATNLATCSGCTTEQTSENVTLDLDDEDAPGTETITISTVRNGTYSYSVHEFYEGYHNRSASIKLATSGANVKVYYNNTTTSYNVPNDNGTVWRVFTFSKSGGLSTINTMTHIKNSVGVY